MNLDGGVIHNEGRLKGWALKSRLFWALKWQRAQRVPFGPKKSRLEGENNRGEFILLQSADLVQYGEHCYTSMAKKLAGHVESFNMEFITDLFGTGTGPL